MTLSADLVIDFERWAALAKNNPQEFEAKRAELLESYIQLAPVAKQQRLRCLQWKVDQIRNNAGSTFHAALKINQLMWESLMGKGGLYDALETLLEGKEPSFREAKVLRFPSESASASAG